ncbi:RNA-binding protein [Agarivorans sp. OAG1]|uniref:Ribosome assembly RNA-binding protein YhbY n=1 Tax=Agarivorans aestuarii TaxID=1563703 RepID=A0ABU7G401_9ALTE|nr:MULTISPECIES: ribosome assembly RNA-binding protein YhbY [Agarivorans]MEE1674063.1 ribosome assembly RNA-binding protein YhbY [Agarivorans aestuarii]BEU04207.1 RNA-binding protein [Agarivorans sp. OAG1]
MQLTNKQKQHLKSLAHNLKPVVMLGSNGLTEGILAEIEVAIAHHELIKVKIATDDREMKQLIADTIADKVSAVKVQVIGHILIIYRPSEDKKIELPRK